MLLVHTHRRGTIVQTLNSYSCLSLSYDPSLFMSVTPECEAEKKLSAVLPDSQNVVIKHTNLDKTLNSKEKNATVKDDQVKTEILES